jgi:hypothetical protein
MHSAVHAHTLTDEELRTIFSRAMGHLNNVPIAYTMKSEADFHYLPLTPGHFLMGSAYAELQPIDKEHKVNECDKIQQGLQRLGAVLEEISGRVDYTPESI